MSQETLHLPTKPTVEGAREPREMAEDAEQSGVLPEGEEERFAGWGIMGVTFTPATCSR